MVLVGTYHDFLIPCLGMDAALRLRRGTCFIAGICIFVYEFIGHLAITSQRASYL